MSSESPKGEIHCLEVCLLNLARVFESKISIEEEGHLSCLYFVSKLSKESDLFGGGLCGQASIIVEPYPQVVMIALIGAENQ